jgi:LPXTG-site transpeptidase (sortase) family protein
MRNISRIFFFVGIVSIVAAGYLTWQRYTPSRLSFKTESVGSALAFVPATAPVRIDIERLGISLPIIPTELIGGKWNATDRGVSFLTSTPVPGEYGNSVLYGHNWPNLLGKLVRITPGDMIDIHLSDGSIRHFRVKYTMKVTPDQTHILESGNDTRITIYTCAGFLDRERFVAVALLEGQT